MKSSETAPNKGFFAICSPNPFIKCYTVSTTPAQLIRAKARARKTHIHAQYWNGETNIYYELRDCVMRGMLDGTPFALDSRDDARFTIKRT